MELPSRAKISPRIWSPNVSLWQYGRPCGETAFEFLLSSGREDSRRFLGEGSGILQTDGYQAHECVGGPVPGQDALPVLRSCAQEVCRDAMKFNPQDGEAANMVTRMDALFLVDCDAREKGVGEPSGSNCARG